MLTLPAQYACFYLRKDMFEAGQRFDIQHGVKARATVVFHRSLERPVKANNNRMGRTPAAPQIVKDPSGCNRMLPKLLPLGARLASAQTGTTNSQSALASFVLCPPPSHKETTRFVQRQQSSTARNGNTDRRMARPTLDCSLSTPGTGSLALSAGTGDGGSRSSFPDLDPSLRPPRARLADIIRGDRLCNPADVESDSPIRLDRSCRIP